MLGQMSWTVVGNWNQKPGDKDIVRADRSSSLSTRLRHVKLFYLYTGEGTEKL